MTGLIALTMPKPSAGAFLVKMEKHFPKRLIKCQYLENMIVIFMKCQLNFDNFIPIRLLV